MRAVAFWLGVHPPREKLHIVEITGQALNLSQLTYRCTHARKDTAIFKIVALHLCNFLSPIYPFSGRAILTQLPHIIHAPVQR